ncbi:MAG: DUF11 domain-containing protein [Chitinophagales bacterium]
MFLVVNSSGTIVQIINGDTDGDGIPNFAEIPAVNTLIDLDINSLPPDTYTVYGFSYRIAPIADAYSPVPAVGQTLSSHQANITAGQCASLSTGAISTIVLNPIVVEATTRCPAVPDGTFFIDVTNVTGGLPEELGIGSYSITNVPGVASYTYGAGTVSSSAITYSSGATIDITALDNNNPDGGDATCVDCSSVVLTLNHLSCVLTSDLQLIKTVNNATPNVGETVTFTITVHNNGPDDATGVAVTDTIPNGYTNIQSISGAGSLSGNNITWSGLSIANGADAVLTFMAEIAAPLNGVTYVNISEITASSNIDPDSTPNDNTETSGDIGSVDNDGTQDITDQDDVDDALVTPLQSDLSLVKTVSASTVNVNDVVTFTITVHNAGPDTATNITVKDVVPLGYTNITSITPSGSLTGQTINWNIASLAVGADAVLSFQSTVTATDSYINIAEIIAVDQFDPDSSPNNNVATSGNIGSEDADGTQNTTLGDPAGEDDVDDAAVSIAPVCNPNVGTWAN